QVGVGVLDADAADRHAEGLGRDLRHDRAAALPDLLATGDDLQRAVVLQLQDGTAAVAVAVHARAAAGPEEPRDPDAAAALPRLRRAQRLDHGLQALALGTRAEAEAQRRHVAGCPEIAAAQLDRIEPDLAGRLVHEAL